MLLSEKITICKMYYTEMIQSRKELLEHLGHPVELNHFKKNYNVLQSLLEDVS